MNNHTRVDDYKHAIENNVNHMRQVVKNSINNSKDVKYIEVALMESYLMTPVNPTEWMPKNLKISKHQFKKLVKQTAKQVLNK